MERVTRDGRRSADGEPVEVELLVHPARPGDPPGADAQRRLRRTRGLARARHGALPRQHGLHARQRTGRVRRRDEPLGRAAGEPGVRRRRTAPSAGARPASYPIRPNWDGTLPVPGDGRYEWDGFHDVDELPGVRDPEQGWFATANQMNLPDGLPADRHVTYDWYAPYPARTHRRGARLAHRLDGRGLRPAPDRLRQPARAADPVAADGADQRGRARRDGPRPAARLGRDAARRTRPRRRCSRSGTAATCAPPCSPRHSAGLLATGKARRERSPASCRPRTWPADARVDLGLLFARDVSATVARHDSRTR